MEIREFKLERYLAQHEFSARYLLCTSDCETLSVRELLSMETGSADAMQDLRLGYTESMGSPQLREEIAQWYDSLHADQIVVTSGAEETIFISLQVLLSPGDHVIVQTPAYQSLHEIPRAINCKVSAWNMSEENGKWHADVETLHELITPATRALVVNSPHNPTGHLFTKDEWKTIQEICDDHHIAIISDEVYRGVEHTPSSRLPAMADVSDNGYSIGVMSKALGLAGLRIGWIASQNPDFVRKFLAFKDYTTICNSGPSEFLATVALRQKEGILQRNMEIIRENLKVLDGFFSSHSELLTWSHPVAGSTAFPRLTKDISADFFCEKTLKESGILLLPGTVFGVDTPHFRIGYGRKDLPENLLKFTHYLSDKSGADEFSPE